MSIGISGMSKALCDYEGIGAALRGTPTRPAPCGFYCCSLLPYRVDNSAATDTIRAVKEMASRMNGPTRIIAIPLPAPVKTNAFYGIITNFFL